MTRVKMTLMNDSIVVHSHGLSCEGKFDVLPPKGVIIFKSLYRFTDLKSNQREDNTKDLQ